eukprot:CAMPEP_0171599698 /NCGR_PEP_ID=MMETSP0990-20121206/3882_1 /TAXON_ID=483369 /ORGANISM="non described non described, Strain CCMP2098" /LENGTH=121 /DNA_ID=CAMNT_0012161513 /DNA_START=596 /DNA_END=962 /DNA_ORIENTATION=+
MASLSAPFLLYDNSYSSTFCHGLLKDSSSFATNCADPLSTKRNGQNVVRAAFDAVDAQGDGSLTAEELGALCTNLGSTLEAHELEATLQTLDTDDNGKIEFGEFMAWWKGGAQTGFNGFLY